MISVCMATYNGGQFIKDQIISILQQLSEEDELIITDDGSSDNTAEIIHNFNDLRIKFYRNKIRLGYIKNFEQALILSSGETIFLADQDDIWLSGKIEKMKQTIKNNKCSAVVCNAQIINTGGAIIGRPYFETRKSGPGLWRNFYKNGYHGCCMAIKRNILENAIPFPIPTVPHDFFLGLVADAENGVVFLDEVFVLHRRHESNTSSANPRGFIQIVTSRLEAVIALLVVFFRR